MDGSLAVMVVDEFNDEVEEGTIVLTGLIRARTKGELRIELCFRPGRIIFERVRREGGRGREP